MITDTILGIISAGLPLLVIGALVLRKMPAVLAFYVALLAVGIGYLATTGAMQDVGVKVRPHIPASLLQATSAPAPAPKPAAPAPAPSTAAEKPAETPPASPPAAPAPAPSPAPAPAPSPAPANP